MTSSRPATSFGTIRTLAGDAFPYYFVQDILQAYPIDTDCDAYLAVDERFIREWSAEMPVDVVEFHGFSALVALSRYQLGGDPEDMGMLEKLLSY